MKIGDNFKRIGQMSLKDSFNSQNYNFAKQSDVVLQMSVAGNSINYHYDFAMRLLTLRYGEALSTQPFSQLDREMLIELREKLIELKGHPPELPPEQPATPPGPRKFTS